MRAVLDGHRHLRLVTGHFHVRSRRLPVSIQVHKKFRHPPRLGLLCFKCRISRVGSNGGCNTIWYKAVFKGGVYETRETVWAFSGAETRRVASVEGRADAA